jgi:hypothetical protein
VSRWNYPRRHRAPADDDQDGDVAGNLLQYDAVMSRMRRVRRGAVALGCVAVLAAGCGSGRPAASPTATSPEASPSSGIATSPQRSGPAARYLAVARAGNRRLDTDFDRLEERDHNRLAAAHADLRDIASTERLFDRRLKRIAFPAGLKPIARRLYRVNQSRARLTSEAAASASLRRLHHYEPRLEAANEPVEKAVKTIRRRLGLPPPPAD